MKIKFFLLLLLSSYTISAQLITNLGARLSISGNTQLTLQNTDFINNGIFSAGNSTISFKGNASSFISGNQPVRFSEIEINKTNNTSVILQQPIGVTNRVVFSSGFLDLNSFNIDLGANGSLENEQEASRIIGENGGQVLLSTVLNAPVAANPGNLGAVIATSQNLGNVIIKRGHQSQSGSGLGNSILRYYDIVPENNIILDEFRVNYFDGELNGIDENSLVFFKSDNVIDWASLAIDSRSVTGNFVSKKNVASFSRWTLAADNSPSLVHFISFNVKCDENKVLITWKTTQEQNSSHFNIERSNDGVSWQVIGRLPAAGNSGIERSYSVAANTSSQNDLYRIAEYDLDGRVQHTGTIRTSCSSSDIFNIWPNPVHEVVYINLFAAAESQAIVRVFDNKGSLVRMKKLALLAGSNHFSVDMMALANGVYAVVVEWNRGQMKKSQQVLKQ